MKVNTRGVSGRTCVCLMALLIPMLRANDGGSILGTIADPQGAPISGAKVTATETATGVAQTLPTDSRGFYAFQSLPVGRYDVQIDAAGFKRQKRSGVVLNVNSKVVVDATLVIGEHTDAVTVSESSTRVETVDTQMGEVITGKQMT